VRDVWRTPQPRFLIKLWAQIREFRAEVDIMACMRHVNIVQFVGACTKVCSCACVPSLVALCACRASVCSRGGVMCDAI
jgi:hypothetical protein